VEQVRRSDRSGECGSLDGASPKRALVMRRVCFNAAATFASAADSGRRPGRKLGPFSSLLAALLLIVAGFGEPFAAEGKSTELPVAESPFTPLHVYYISPQGNDHRAGTSVDGAWATPRHNVNCGDVIIALAGSYSKSFGANNWGAVSNCPSTSGGIDGAGGVYFAIVLCAGPYVTSCPISAGDAEAARIDASNWAMEGFWGTSHGQACFSATSESATTLHHIAFINVIGSNCQNAAVDTYSWTNGGCSPPYTSCGGVDQQAIVGAIAWNAAQANDLCGSGISNIPFNGPDTSSGTHVFDAGIFSYANRNGKRCSGYDAVVISAPAASPGVVYSASLFTPYEPITFSVSEGSLPGGLNSSTIYYVCSRNLVTNTSFEVSATQNCAAPISFTSPGTGAMKVQTLKTTDGEGVIFDSWAYYAYKYQGVLEQSVMWGNGSSGFEYFSNTGTAGNEQSREYVSQVTSYGNLQDPYHYANISGELLFQGNRVNPPYGYRQVEDSIFEATTATQGGTPSAYCSRGSTYGCLTVGALIAFDPATATTSDILVQGNYIWNSTSGSTSPGGRNTVLYNPGYNNKTFTLGENTYNDPGFANPNDLPTNAPNCNGYTNTTACMNAGYKVAANLNPTVAVGKGYQAPRPCRPDPYFPVWLKGIVFLHWNGSTLTQNGGLITKPCNM
jgi:hypothetical protein